jgi:hypothetical protein
MGHLLHGSSLALPNHALRYGFLTINGSTGGVKVDASATAATSTSTVVRNDRIVPSLMKSPYQRKGSFYRAKDLYNGQERG